MRTIRYIDVAEYADRYSMSEGEARALLESWVKEGRCRRVEGEDRRVDAFNFGTKVTATRRTVCYAFDYAAGQSWVPPRRS